MGRYAADVLSTPVTPSRRSVRDQHSCCKSAEHGNKEPVHRNSLTFKRSRRQWRLAPVPASILFSRRAKSDTSQQQIVRQSVCFSWPPSARSQPIICSTAIGSARVLRRDVVGLYGFVERHRAHRPRANSVAVEPKLALSATEASKACFKGFKGVAFPTHDRVAYVTHRRCPSSRP